MVHRLAGIIGLFREAVAALFQKRQLGVGDARGPVERLAADGARLLRSRL